MKLVWLAALALPLPGGPASLPEPDPPPYALLAGTVFTSDGFSLPGVQVSVKRKEDRKPRWHVVSDRRGEFALRLPAARTTYEVSTHSRTHQNETRTVELAAPQRVDLVFRLAPKDSKRRPE